MRVKKISILLSHVKREVEKRKYRITPYFFKWDIPLYRQHTLQSKHIYIYKEYILYIYKYKIYEHFVIKNFS